MVGTITEKGQFGTTSSILELMSLNVNNVMSEDEMKDIRISLDPSAIPSLTDEERNHAARLQDARVRALAEKTRERVEKNRIATEKHAKETEIMERDAKVRRAQSFVESGKLLLKNGNQSGAKKLFEKAAVESPDSTAGKEAQRLLDELPQ